MYLREASRRLKKPPGVVMKQRVSGVVFHKVSEGKGLKGVGEREKGALPMRLEVMNVMVSSSLYL